MFLHGGWLHFIGNMWTLWIFGDNVEDRMGPGRFLVFYLLCGLAASLVHYFTNLQSTVPTVGRQARLRG
jgi:membrane associated rhomboid family serine protease